MPASGVTAGVVTVEDLLEEIVGDIRDEHDEEAPDVERVGDRWRVSGLLRTDEVAEATEFRAPEGDYETIGGGLDTDAPLDDQPRWTATVVRMDGRRIDLVDLAPAPPGRSREDQS